jgi:hypothetical protein
MIGVIELNRRYSLRNEAQIGLSPDAAGEAGTNSLLGLDPRSVRDIEAGIRADSLQFHLAIGAYWEK